MLRHFFSIASDASFFFLVLSLGDRLRFECILCCAKDGAFFSAVLFAWTSSTFECEETLLVER
jgi:hypothetical protein